MENSAVEVDLLAAVEAVLRDSGLPTPSPMGTPRSRLQHRGDLLGRKALSFTAFSWPTRGSTGLSVSGTGGRRSSSAGGSDTSARRDRAQLSRTSVTAGSARRGPHSDVAGLEIAAKSFRAGHRSSARCAAATSPVAPAAQSDGVCRQPRHCSCRGGTLRSSSASTP